MRSDNSEWLSAHNVKDKVSLLFLSWLMHLRCIRQGVRGDSALDTAKDLKHICYFAQQLSRFSFFLPGSPGDWFCTVLTHYFPCWLKTDPVTPCFPGFQATQYGRTSCMSSLCVVLSKEKQIDTEETQSKCQRRKRCFKIWQCHFWERKEERERKEGGGGGESPVKQAKSLSWLWVWDSCHAKRAGDWREAVRVWRERASEKWEESPDFSKTFGILLVRTKCWKRATKD